MLGYGEARTEMEMDSKRKLSPVMPHQDIICTHENKRVGRIRTQQDRPQLVRKSRGFTNLAPRFEQLGQGHPDSSHQRGPPTLAGVLMEFAILIVRSSSVTL